MAFTIAGSSITGESSGAPAACSVSATTASAARIRVVRKIARIDRLLSIEEGSERS